MHCCAFPHSLLYRRQHCRAQLPPWKEKCAYCFERERKINAGKVFSARSHGPASCRLDNDGECWKRLKKRKRREGTRGLKFQGAYTPMRNLGHRPNRGSTCIFTDGSVRVERGSKKKHSFLIGLRSRLWSRTKYPRSAGLTEVRVNGNERGETKTHLGGQLSPTVQVRGARQGRTDDM